MTMQITKSSIDVEQWKPIDGYLGLYEVSSFGRVRSLDADVVNRPDGGTRRRKGRVLKQKAPKAHAYLVVSLSKNSVVTDHLVHVLVARAFLKPDPTRPYVNHKDFNPHNNRSDNLERATALENVHHSKRAGRLRNGTTKLTEADVRTIRERHAGGATYIQLAADYGIAFGSIGKIIRGERWTSVQ